VIGSKPPERDQAHSSNDRFSRFWEGTVMSKTRLRFVFLAAAIGLSATVAFGQMLPPLGSNTVVGRTSVQGNSGQAQAIPFAELAAALSVQAGLIQGPATATPGHVLVFGSVPNSVVDGGVPSGTGTVTAVSCGTGLSGGTFTTMGTCAVSLSNLTNSLGADVALNNTSNYFDGPSVAQGVTGTWYASGTVTLTDTGANVNMSCKLWDGTNAAVASANTFISVGSFQSQALSGVVTSPSGNIRMSCKDINATTGKIVSNQTGLSKDSTVSVYRIQ
jgi:hypothetical protein